MVLNAQRVGGVDEYAGMLRSDDGFDDCGKVVHIWESLHAKQDIIEGALFAVGSIFRRADHCLILSAMYSPITGMGVLTLPGLEALISKSCGSAEESIARPSTTRRETWSDVLEGDAELTDSIEARLPYQRHIAGIGGLEPP